MDNNFIEEGIQLVPDYESDSECCTDSEESVLVAKKKPKLSFDWKLVQKFDNIEQAKTFVKAERSKDLRTKYKKFLKVLGIQKVCDAAKSIQNAFLEVFGEHVVVRMCWAHAKRKIQERIERIKNKVLRDNILNDVDSLHSITDENIFDAASEAFLQKYKDQIEFVTYFRAQWLTQNRNWFLGAAPNSPSTNNALESFNRVIKDSNTLRERFPLSRFLVVAKEMVNQWSNKYITNPEDNYIANVPSLTTKHWTEAYYFDAQWESFDDFKKQNFSKWLVTLPIERNDWIKGRCDCPAFFNLYICKHVIGLAIRLKYVVPPLEAKNIPIGEKRKRGRPSKAKRALIIQ
ncbi:uncharacterized protein LOC126376791 [Pectinophora gossypiella]|uniref:uncharacterized protein LOC126376791 n=1 Tax=Pectinophora gossypiella TaxID=13191 RepID=UPI00214EBC60|nr:uncharacterized protein LOC126376791 [Pectinophora gossypiella]